MLPRQPRLEAEAVAIQEKVRAALSASGPLAYFELSMTTDFGPPQRVHVTVDVVEQADTARRMPFRVAPTSQIADPDGLIAGWSEYQAKVFELAFGGTSLRVDADACPVLHCAAPFDIPELAPYLERFRRRRAPARGPFDIPASSDRNKAGYTLAALAGQPRYRAAIREAVPVALRVLRSEKPNNHDPAYQILTKISGETFGERDYAAWERWAAVAR